MWTKKVAIFFGFFNTLRSFGKFFKAPYKYIVLRYTVQEI